MGVVFQWNLVGQPGRCPWLLPSNPSWVCGGAPAGRFTARKSLRGRVEFMRQLAWAGRIGRPRRQVSRASPDPRGRVQFMRRVACECWRIAWCHAHERARNTRQGVARVTTEEWEWLSGADSCQYRKQLRRYYSTTTPAVSIGKLLPLTAGHAGHGEGTGSARFVRAGTQLQRRGRDCLLY